MNEGGRNVSYSQNPTYTICCFYTRTFEKLKITWNPIFRLEHARSRSHSSSCGRFCSLFLCSCNDISICPLQVIKTFIMFHLSKQKLLSTKLFTRKRTMAHMKCLLGTNRVPNFQTFLAANEMVLYTPLPLHFLQLGTSRGAEGSTAF